jgi:hypothetical protein
MNKQQILIYQLHHRMNSFTLKEIRDFVRYMDCKKRIDKLEGNFIKVNEEFKKINWKNEVIKLNHE